MIYGCILAGGVGSRMGNDKPKQYINIGGKPILLHTVEKFCLCNEFDGIIILCPKDWIEYTKGLVKKHISSSEKIEVIEGGDTRNETIQNAIKHIENAGNLDENTVIVTHDAVRPFVTYRIIKENIEAALAYGACDTVIPATDTIVESVDGTVISNIPDRAKLYQGQTPQSFKALKLKKLYESLTEDEKNILTDAAKIFVIKGEAVSLVDGEISNVKITYPYDLTVAESLLKGEMVR
jgi:2-C-methyl-D-erythritol 4-phosphate cytidylyltransferase